MLISYKYNKHLGKDAVTDKHLYEYTIIDSDFTVSVTDTLSNTGPAGGWLAFAVAVIQEYSKRNLNVAANLVRLAQFLNKIYNLNLEHIFNYWKEHIPEYKKYEDEMQKYVVLL